MYKKKANKFIGLLGVLIILALFTGCGDSDDDDDDDGSGGGEAALTVVSTSPTNGALGVPRDVEIDITFSQEIDPLTLTDQNISLTFNDTAINSAITLNETGRIIRITPAFPLAAQTSYTVRVRSGVRDLDGNALSSDYVFSFTTVGLPALGSWTKVSAGWHNGAAINQNGTIWVWGCNVMGQLGNGLNGGDGSNLTPEELETKHRYDRHMPIQVGNNPDWETVSSGRECVYAIMTNGLLWGWGQGPFSAGGFSNVPVQFGINSQWDAVEASIGTMFTCAMKTDGTLWAWGDNASGQLGNGAGGTLGSSEYSSVPVQVTGSTDWESFAAGAAHAVAIRDNGTLWAWGDNQFGELGDGTGGDGTHAHDATVPVQVESDSDWSSVAAKGAFTMAIKDNGTLWAWGSNGYGQLGIGSTANASAPIQVGTATNWASVAPGWDHVAAIRRDGTLWTWGNNHYGQLGDSNDGNAIRTSPRQVGTDTNWSSVSSGGHFTLALKKDGTIWGWGRNDYGQLGIGTNTNQTTPAQIEQVDFQQ